LKEPQGQTAASPRPKPSNITLLASPATLPRSGFVHVGGHQTVDLVYRLEKESRLGKAGALAAQLSRLDLIVIDKLGYLPFIRSGGELLFHLVTSSTSAPR
jgi:hypothetical protein